MRHRLVVLGVYVTTCLLYLCCRAINPACDCVVYQSYGLNTGRFTSPNYPDPYPPSINCILFSFIGDANEIIELTFIDFDLKMPDEHGNCVDFLKVYQNLERPEVNEHSQHDIEYCGDYNSNRKTVYSSGRSMVLEFHADFRKGVPGKYKGFSGIYKFLDKREYETTGVRVQGKQCTYDFTSNATHRHGQFFSPFYPQHYKPLSSCRYRFHARDGERVNIVFTNIQLHHIDATCRDSPDVIVVHDGADDTAPVIGQFCGTHNGEEFISTGRSLFITFSCDDRDQQQGFSATYKFISKSSMVPKSVKNHSADAGGVPVTGSKFSCNENIDSRTHRNGTIVSPYHPNAYPAATTCLFTFTGIGRERIRLRFQHLDLHYPSGDPASPIDCSDSDSISVYIVIGGKTEELETWCGRKLPPMLMSSQPKMIVKFQSHYSSQDVSGFKADYSFVSNFGIEGGEQDNRGTCAFNYRSTHRSSGEIWSPNYGGLYPRNTECHYLFYGKKNEQVRIDFIDFDVDGINPRCEEGTRSDYVSFSNFANTEDRKMTRLCGTRANAQRTIWSDGPFFRVIFKSNEVYDSTGFHARYKFVKVQHNGERSSSGRFSTYSKPGDTQYGVDDRKVGTLPSKRNGDENGSTQHVTSSSLYLCLLLSLIAVFSRQIAHTMSFTLVTGIHSKL